MTMEGDMASGWAAVPFIEAHYLRKGRREGTEDARDPRLGRWRQPG